MKVTAALFVASVAALAKPAQNDVNAPLIPQSLGAPPQQVTIEKTGYSGNGCPAGSVSTLISPDKTVVTFGFDTFQAVIGPGSKPADKQKNCQLHLGLRYPSGYQLSIMTATYHGYVRLDPGVSANFISSYYFSQAAEKTAMTKTTLQGPEYTNGKTYTKSDSIQNESMIWSPCGANGILNVNNRIALTSRNANAAGEISNDDATLKFEQKLHIQWRSCPGNRRDVETSAMDNVNTVTDSVVEIN